MTRRLGRSSVPVTELAFGAATLGNMYTPVAEEDARATVDAAWDRGVRAFDTAPHYGLGLSERRLGAALAGRARDGFTVSTKVGRLLEPLDGPVVGDDLANGFAVPAAYRRVWDFSADGVRRSIEASLVRLGLDRVDVVYLHDPDEHAEQALTQAYPALEQLRAQGVIGAIGAGMNQSALLARFVRETDVDVVLLAGRYSLLDQSALSELLPQAAQRGVSVVVGGVFNSGLLADPKPGATYDYAAAPDGLLQRALRIKAVCEAHQVPLRAAALRFPLTHPAVASVLVGLRNPHEAHDAADMMKRQIPDALWPALQAEGLLPEEAVPSRLRPGVG
jgi:D-threo-aldose 1-dehydrogenase